jgi:hypothetical protein
MPAAADIGRLGRAVSLLSFDLPAPDRLPRFGGAVRLISAASLPAPSSQTRRRQADHLGVISCHLFLKGGDTSQITAIWRR